LFRTVTRRQAKGNLLQHAAALITILAGVVLQSVQGGVFVPTGSLQEPRADHTATLLANGKVLVAGGYGTNILTLASAELYNPVTGDWTLTGALNTPRSTHQATLLTNGKVLVVGGGNGTVRSLGGAELYDPATGTWTVTGSLTTGRVGHTATLLLNGKVLVVGGERYDGTHSFSLGSAELYDPATGIWTASGSLNEAHEYHTATLLPNGKVLVAGGFNDVSPWTTQLDSAELYDPVAGTWTLTGPLSDGRSSHTATLLLNGKVLVAGGGVWGFNSNVFPLDSAELYDPANGTWTLTGASTLARWAPTATLLANGHVLVAGGQDSWAFPFSSAEEYDPVNGVWSSTGSMMTNRSDHSTTLLANGKVLAAGGNNGYLSSAELYDPGTGIPVPQPTFLTDSRIFPDGRFQFGFTNTPGASISVLASTNPVLPLVDWTLVGSAIEIVPGHFQFTDSQRTNFPQRFYHLRSP
jgi:hypothetical protein